MYSNKLSAGNLAQLFSALLLLVGLAFASPVVGQSAASAAFNGWSSGQVRAGNCVGNVPSYDNSVVNNNGIASQFFPDFGGAGLLAAEDFTTGPADVSICSVTVPGVAFGGGTPASVNANTVRVIIYANAGGSPGAVIYQEDFAGSTVDPEADADLFIEPTTPMVLAGNTTYWMTVAPIMAIGTFGQWGWETNSTANGNQLHFQDTDGLLGGGPCAGAWGNANTDCGIGVSTEAAMMIMYNDLVVPCNEELNLGCIANLNVTLGNACTATITPQMVLTGSLGCADDIIVTVDGGSTDVVSGCGVHTYSVDVIQNGVVVYTCWGNVLAEDKTNPDVVCPADVSSIGATYQQQTYAGSIGATSPQLNMGNYSCFTDFFNPVPGNHSYSLITFTPSITDVYTFVGESNDFDVVLSLFQGDFNPGNPCQNIVGHVAVTFTQTFPSALTNIFNLGDLQRLSLPLVAGRSYTMMVSNANDGNLGNYTVRAFSDGSGTVSNFTAPAPVVFDLDLVCGDLEAIRFTSPRSWIVNANGTLDVVATRNTFFGGSQAALDAFLTKLGYTGIPVATDNCGQVLVTLSDVVATAGDCGDVTLSRTFTIRDRYNSACTGTPRTDVCTQTITFRKLVPSDLVLPPFTAPIECDEDFATDGNVGGPDDNPAASVVGYPWVITAFGFQDLAQSYCNYGASYSDEPRINVCSGTYKFRREWNIINWCNPGSSSIWNQLVKVADYTGPVLAGIPAAGYNISTSPFSCAANIAVPVPGVTDGNGCSSAFPTSWTVLAGGTTYFANGV
ncbi:MAG: hypothetical protein C7N36_05815, partial [Bacteroidetes bacterium]